MSDLDALFVGNWEEWGKQWFHELPTKMTLVLLEEEGEKNDDTDDETPQVVTETRAKKRKAQVAVLKSPQAL